MKAIAALAGAPFLAQAQSKPYTIIVPFPAGGGTDTMARSFANHFSARLNTPVVVYNRAGAGGLIGASALLQAPPNGRTLLLSSNGLFTINPAVRSVLPYDPVSSFAGLGILGTTPLAILVKSDSKFQSLKELVAAAGQRPDELTYASFGQGSVAHFAGELFKGEAGISMLHVPFRGSAPAMQALLGNQVTLSFDTITAALPHLQSGKLRCLAVTSAKRDEALPETPTVSEMAIPGFNFITWVAIVTRRDVAQADITRLRSMTKEVLALPDQAKELRKLSLDVRDIAALDFDQLVATEIPRYRAVASKAGIKADS